MPLVLIIEEAIKRKKFPLQGKCLIGRSSSCDLRPDDHLISSKHVEMSLIGGKVYYKDLNSTNGTYINDIKGTSGQLRVGDQLRIGQTIIKLDPLAMTPKELELNGAKDKTNISYINLPGEARELGRTKTHRTIKHSTDYEEKIERTYPSYSPVIDHEIKIDLEASQVEINLGAIPIQKKNETPKKEKAKIEKKEKTHASFPKEMPFSSKTDTKSLRTKSQMSIARKIKIDELTSPKEKIHLSLDIKKKKS